MKGYNHILAAHVRAYNVIHDLYAAEGWLTPQVTLNTYCSDLYWSEKVIWDLLNHQKVGIKPQELPEYIVNNAKHLDRALSREKLPFRRNLPYFLGKVVHQVSNKLGYRLFGRVGEICAIANLRLPRN
jgi:6-phospho-beta-galactosidase